MTDPEYVPLRELPELREMAREVAREEISSLCGLLLKRMGESGAGRGMGTSDLATVESAFGEALRDFSATESEPGT